MQNLNDRLASYIETVRSREAEIKYLREERSSIEETHTTEITQTKAMFNKEIGQLRKALDKVSQDNSRLQVNHDKAEREAKEAKQDLAAKAKDLEKLQRDFKVLQSSYNDLSTRATNAENDVKQLRPENARLAKSLETSKKNLEDETLQRIDLQNQLMSLEEQLKFENQMLESQLNETRTRKQLEISQIDGELKNQYEAKLQTNLDELRAGYQKELEESRKDFTRMYDDKLKNLQEKYDKEKVSSAGFLQEIREMSTKVSALTSKNVELEGSNASLQKRIAELQKEMDDLAAKMRADMALKDAEIKNKEEQMEYMKQDFQQLTEVKIALDMEIAAYAKLLTGEENRLGLSPESSPVGPQRGVKRKRTIIEEEEVFDMVSEHEGKGTIIIEPVKKEAKFIRIVNKSLEDQNIGGWTLSNDANGQESTYKFHRSTTLKPGDICTVWSADSGQEHAPPTNLVMKKGGWVIGGENTTTLTNKDNEAESTRKSWETKRHAGLHRSGIFGSSSTTDDQSKSCAIM